MRSVIAGESASFAIRLGDGQPVIPDANSLSYSVFGHDGAVLAGLQDVAMATGNATIMVPVPGSAHAVGPGLSFERRKVIVSYQVTGQTRMEVLRYRVTPEPVWSVTMEDIRSWIGVRKDELEDGAIDLYEVYLELRELMNPGMLDAALGSGTRLEMVANEALKMLAVLRILPSLKNRMAQSESNGIIAYERPMISDFDLLAATAQGRLSSAMALLSGVSPGSMNFVLTTTNSDPVTG